MAMSAGTIGSEAAGAEDGCEDAGNSEYSRRGNLMNDPGANSNNQLSANTELSELIQNLKVEAEGFENAYNQIDKIFNNPDASYSEQDKDNVRFLLAETRKEIRRIFSYSFSDPQRPYVPNKDHIKKIIFGDQNDVQAHGGLMKAGDRDCFHLALEIFSAIRAMIVNEDTLINHRISWQIAIQGGVALAFVHFHDTANYNFFAEMIILGAGILFSVFCFVGVLAAFQAVKVFKDTLHNYQDVLLPGTEAMPRATGDRYVARRGAIVGYAYAVLPGLLWFFIGVTMIHDRVNPATKPTIPVVTSIKNPVVKPANHP